MNRLVIIGASGHGKVVADIATHCGYKTIAFLDDNPNVRSCFGFPVIGTSSDAVLYTDAYYIVAIGNAKTREAVQSRLYDQRLHVATLIHPDAAIAGDVQIGKGTVIMAGAVINPGSVIGDGCIINTGSTVDHDNRIENYVHVSVGCHLAGTVSVGKSTWIGAGAIINNNLHICGDCMIGAGAVVIRNIEMPGTYVGVPAKRMLQNIEKYKNLGGGVISSQLLSYAARNEAA